MTPYHLAIAYTGIGERDSAFAALRRACEDRDATVTSVGVDPRLRPLKTDGRFARLLGEIGLQDFYRPPL